MTILLSTVHGSHLYGLAVPESDRDTYRVTDGSRRRVRQKITGDDDVTTITLGLFIQQCNDGVPQALEAMFSPLADPGSLDAMRAGYRVDTAAMASRYLRTIRRFALDDRYEPGSRAEFKRRRHALRLALNLDEALLTGRFNPTLTAARAAEITRAAREGELGDHLARLCRIEISLESSLETPA